MDSTPKLRCALNSFSRGKYTHRENITWDQTFKILKTLRYRSARLKRLFFTRIKYTFFARL